MTHYIGKKFPAQGWVTLEAVTRLNLYKRSLLSAILPLTNKNLIFSAWPLIFLPWKRKISILEGFIDAQNRLAYLAMQQDFYVQERYGAPAREVSAFLKNFLTHLGVNPGLAQQFGITIGHIVEFDSAYRYRLLDLMAETTPEKLGHGTEIKRLLKIYGERDSRSALTKRFNQVGLLFSILLLSRHIRTAFRKALQESTFSNFQMTPADFYHTLLDNGKYEMGYDWGGKSKEERVALYENLHIANVYDKAVKSRTVHWYPPYKIIQDLTFNER